MQNYDNDNYSAYDYRGKRGLILLRVSTEEQEKKYGFSSQLREVMEKVVNIRGIRIVDTNKYIKYDTYTGMEFREREVLTEILEMAKRREFDVLVMDVLDRLGRTGLPREIYRAELRMHGIHILTTKPEEHADDDSLMGQMIRLLHGFKSEGERNDIVRRTMNGTRERVLRDHKLLGSGKAKYGFKYKDEDRSAYILDDDPIKIKRDGKILQEESGDPWTKAKVRRRMFEWIDQGWTIRGIAKYLTSQHVPTNEGDLWDAKQIKLILQKRGLNLENNQPILAYGYLIVLDENNEPYTEASIAQLVYELSDKCINEANIAQVFNQKEIPTGKESSWHPSTVSIMLTDEYVIGKAPVFQTQAIRESGEKRRRVARPKSERIYLPDGVVQPILVTEDGRPDIALFERVQKRKEANQEGAPRNNHQPKEFLVRGGYIKCGYCGANMTTMSGGKKRPKTVYRCSSVRDSFGRCQGGAGNSIPVHIADNAAWEKAVEIIRDPSEVNRKLEGRKTADPNADRREVIKNELTKIKASRTRLTARLEDEDLDDETYADIKLRLKGLAEKKRGFESELEIEINIHEEWSKAQDQLKNFHQKCDEYRKKMDDPSYKPDYDFKREAIEFFGIIVRIRKEKDGDRIVVESNPPSIVSNSVWVSYGPSGLRSSQV
jgi:DNA invertase Pin-like site-specific DNA recombinase